MKAEKLPPDCLLSFSGCVLPHSLQNGVAFFIFLAFNFANSFNKVVPCYLTTLAGVSGATRCLLGVVLSWSCLLGLSPTLCTLFCSVVLIRFKMDALSLVLARAHILTPWHLAVHFTSDYHPPVLHLSPGLHWQLTVLSLPLLSAGRHQ